MQHYDIPDPLAGDLSHARRKRLGTMLLEKGLITQEQLEHALRKQPGSKLKLGQIFIEDNIVDELNIVRVLAEQLRIDMYDPDVYPADPKLAELVPEALAHKFKLVPLKATPSLLYLAMIDPTDLSALDIVIQSAGLDVEPVICTEQQYVTHFYNLYGRMLVGIHDVDIESETSVMVEDSTFTISSLQYMAEDAPVVKLVNAILVQALDKRASDIHIQPEQEVIQLRFRVDGKLEEAPAPPKAFFLPFISRIKLLSNMDISISRIPQDGRFTYRTQDREISVRTSTVPSIYGEKVVMRLLDQTKGALDLEELGMYPPEQQRLIRATRRPSGMILATGPTGSGKTTLLYSLLKSMNTPDVNIITLEDPVEYRVRGICQIQLNRKAGMNFANGMRAVLRQDPDVIMVGEIRDKETADIAIKSALTGHTVLSTLHTNDSCEAVTRLLEMGIEPFLISSTLLAIIAQRLLRTICTSCVEQYEASQEQLQMLRVSSSNPVMLSQGLGCKRCAKTGFLGRVGIYEVLDNARPIQELTLKRSSSHDIRTAALKLGNFRTLRTNAARKVIDGVTTFEEFLSIVMDD